MPSIIKGSDNFNSKPYASFPIGVPFALWDHMVAAIIPDNQGDVKFIKLTANDAYNDGLLINEVVSGSAPLVEAEAEIAVGPLTGQVVPLINTEQRFLRAGASGTKQMDQMQRVTGGIRENANGIMGRSSSAGNYTIAGAFEETQIRTDGSQFENGSGGIKLNIDFDSANSPDARASSTTDGETRPKNITATYYMRIA